MSYLAQEQWLDLNKSYLMAAVGQVKAELLDYSRDWKLKYGQANEKQTIKPAEKESIDNPLEEISITTALQTLVDCFQLTTFERKILVMCAGVELDIELAGIIADLQNQSTQLPTLSLAMAAFKDAHWSAIYPEAPLRYWNLIDLSRSELITQSSCAISEYILHYLIGIHQMDNHLSPYLKLILPENNLAPSHENVATTLSGQLAGFTKTGENPLVHVLGDNHEDKALVVAGALAGYGFSTYQLQSVHFPTEYKDQVEFVRLWNRSALLNQIALFIDHDDIEQSENKRLKYFVENAVGIVVLGGENKLLQLEKPILTLRLEKPLRNEQENIWRNQLGPLSETIDGALDEVIGQFNLNIQSIKKLATIVVAGLNTPGQSQLAADDVKERIWQTCCEYTRPHLDNLAQRIEPLATWDDLVLPEMQKNILKEIAVHVKHRQKVYYAWGFAGKSNRGLGISAMFSGESGTGKTMASEVLANELKLDLYRIDLSQVVNKYIGETEKNLKKVFDAAEGSGAILLFDEADALFGKRSEVKDSHDRYSNIEVSYLLQKMEEYRGLAILTTNMKASLDKAFLRRIRFVVHFPFPDASMRAEIWKRIFPKQTPTQALNLQKLSALNVAGGNIRNIALNAAFLAAGKGTEVTMQDIQQAARSEYQKLEKQMSAAESLL